jgi:FixJ family two-component response regulator
MKSTLHDRSDDTSDQIVIVIDDDPDVREGLSTLFESVHLQVRTFGSAWEFFRSNLMQSEGCLVVDVRLPGLSGLDLQTKLAEIQIDIPIIFVTGYGDIPMAVKAVKAGAIDFLTKPVREQNLLDAVKIAFDRNCKRRESENRRRDSEKRTHDMRVRFGELRTGEREVMTLVTAGIAGKDIATELGISPNTVKLYNNRILQKFGTKSLVELVRIADTLGLHIVTAASLASAVVSTNKEPASIEEKVQKGAAPRDSSFERTSHFVVEAKPEGIAHTKV